MDWEAVIDRYGDALLLYAKRWSCSNAAAEDLVQEGFVRLWRSSNGQDLTEKDMPGCLYVSIRRAALDRIRSDARRKDRETAAVGDAASECQLFAGPDEAGEERIALEAAIRNLPGEQGEVLLMKIWGGLTFREIAGALDASPNTVASRYRLALESLRKTLDEDVMYGKK